MTGIGEAAFDNCIGLTHVYYYGTELGWGAITIGNNNTSLTTAVLCCMSSPYSNPDFVLPASTRSIKSEAFRGIPAQRVKLSERCATIGIKAFADCPNLTAIYIPASCSSIAVNAFEGVTNLTIYGVKNSFAEFYAGRYGFAFVPVTP